MNVLQMLLISLALNGVFFIIAAALKTDVFTDITYSLTFVLLAALLAAFGGGKGIAGIAAAAMVIMWGLRLGGYLFYRILHIKVDHRFDDKRDNFVRFGSFWLLQAITVWVVMLPVYGLANASSGDSIPAWAIAVSIAFFAIGLAIEAVSDAQKFSFKSKPENRGKFMSSGLWKWSRHPNYFGEMLLWWAIAFPGAFAFRGASWLYFLGPLFITLLISFVSGIPLLEKSADEKWGTDEEYLRYRRTTSILVPLPPKRD